MHRCIVYASLLVLVIAAVVPIGVGEQTNADSGAPKAQVLQVEQAWVRAEKNHDSAAFERLVVDDWIGITPEGRRQTKADRAAEIRSFHVSPARVRDMKLRVLDDSFESTGTNDLKIRVFGDTGVVTGTDDETTLENGRKSSGHYVWTDVFIKRNGRWLAVSSQTAQIK